MDRNKCQLKPLYLLLNLDYISVFCSNNFVSVCSLTFGEEDEESNAPSGRLVFTKADGDTIRNLFKKMVAVNNNNNNNNNFSFIWDPIKYIGSSPYN